MNSTKNNKMISFATSPVTYASDLEARTQFVLNRLDFLKSIPIILADETLPANVTKVMILRDNNYIPLIVRCVMDNNEEIYDNAIWAVANLLGSDDEKVSKMTYTAITEEVLDRICTLIASPTASVAVRTGLCYLIYNMSNFDLPDTFCFRVGGPLLRSILDVNLKLRTGAVLDYLSAIHNIANTKGETIEAEFLIDALSVYPSNSAVYRLILRIIGTMSEQDGLFSPNALSSLLTCFTEQLDEVNTKQRREMLWILSNVMVETLTPVMFYSEHTELKKLVVDIAWEELCTGKAGVHTDGVGVGAEALFVLSNFMEGVKRATTEFKQEVANDYFLESVLSSCAGHDNARIRTMAQEALTTLDSFKPVVTRPAEPEVIDLATTSEYEANADDDDDCLIHAATYASVPLVNTDEQSACPEGPVPSAADLLLGSERGYESANVRRIVNLLVNLPVGEWASVPADWSLTVADLTVLQHLGYTIVDGWVGINTEIYSGY